MSILWHSFILGSNFTLLLFGRGNININNNNNNNNDDDDNNNNNNNKR